MIFSRSIAIEAISFDQAFYFVLFFLSGKGEKRRKSIRSLQPIGARLERLLFFDQSDKSQDPGPQAGDAESNAGVLLPSPPKQRGKNDRLIAGCVDLFR